MDKGAIFSENRRFRYVLWRLWDESKPKIMFIGYNPSDANEDEDDPTIRRVIGLSKQWGYGGVYMLNLNPYISSNPKTVLNFPSIKNDGFIERYSKECKTIVFAWGKLDKYGRANGVINMFPKGKCIIKNLDGSPRHPLYVPNSCKLIKYR